MLKQQVSQLQQHLEKLDGQMMELEVLKENLGVFSEEKGGEMYAPIANGIFVKADLKDTQNLLVNVGGNVVVSKTVDDTKVMISEQIKEIESYHVEITDQVEKLNTKSETIHEELVKMVDKDV